MSTIKAMGSSGENKENLLTSEDVKRVKILSLDTSEKDKEGLTKVRKKVTPVPPLSLPPPSPLSPSAEEFHFPSHVTSLPSNTTTLPTLFSNLSLTPPFTPCFPPTWQSVTAIVEQPGFISFQLRYGMVLDISANMDIKLKNISKESSICLSSCTTQVAIEHPKGRMLQYGTRLEIQCEDVVSVKNAKVFPRGISFTANNMALVYLLDEAGARSTSDMFHDLYATQITEMLFTESCSKQVDGVTNSIRQLDGARYWRTDNNIDCWVVGLIFIQQMEDGLVIVERETRHGNRVLLKSSPSNGKIRFESSSLQMTASMGKDSHMFLRSRDRRLHYSGETMVFTVRNAGHSAGFDEEGSLRIF